MMKQKIIEQSIQLFESKGFSETSIQDIVSALGATKGTFYYYFTSKEQLLMDIHSNYINELLEKQRKIMNSSGDYKTKVIDVIRLLITEIEPNGRKASIFYRELINLNEENQQVIKEKRKEFRFNLQELIEKGMDNGEFRRDLRADMVCFAILGMCNWSYNWFDPAGTVSDQKLTEIYAKTLLDGISVENRAWQS
jgi:AcrR family transcriptional regulator